jgi:hypothetical protein
MRGIDHQRPAVGIEHVDVVNLAWSIVGVGTVDDVQLGPASKLPLVTGGGIEVGWHRKLDLQCTPIPQRHLGQRGRVSALLTRQTAVPRISDLAGRVHRRSEKRR